MALTITQPRNTTFRSGTQTVSLVWNPTFGMVRTSQFRRAQVYVDSEVLRYCSPLVPFRTGALDRSGKTGTNLGEGNVRYIVPYASWQYYCTAQTRDYDAQRGGMFFERMKTAHKQAIRRGMSSILKGR